MTETAVERPHISPSQLETYFTCGERWRRRYLDGDIVAPGVAVHRGVFPHAAADANWKYKIVSGTDLPESRLLELGSEAFDASVRDQGYQLTRDEASIGARTVLGRAKDMGMRLTALFRRRLAPMIQPLLSEHTIRVPLPNSTHDIIGRLDLVEVDDTIRDLKTSEKAKSVVDLESDAMNFYAAAYEYETGRMPKRVVIDNLIARKSGTDLVSLVGRKDLGDKAVLVNRINAMLKGVRAGVFLPATPGHWKCSPKWCGYWSTCPFVNAERRDAAERSQDE